MSYKVGKLQTLNQGKIMMPDIDDAICIMMTWNSIVWITPYNKDDMV